VKPPALSSVTDVAGRTEADVDADAALSVSWAGSAGVNDWIRRSLA
jgi:hypothetical protein